MKKAFLKLAVLAIIAIGVFGILNFALDNSAGVYAQNASAECKKFSILGIQGWYKYLSFKTGPPACELDIKDAGFVWLVAAGLLDALLRLSALIAAGFFLFGGFKLITSQGNPEHVKAGKETMKNAIIGTVICIVGIGIQSIIMAILGVK